MFDGSGNILGEIEDYNNDIWNFKILPIILIEPNDKLSNVPVNPVFKWDGPNDVYKYEFWLSNDDDPDVENPEVIIDVPGPESLVYPLDGEFPLEDETTYHWKVVPKDVNNNYGLPSSFSNYNSSWEFTTRGYSELVGPLSGTTILGSTSI